MIISQLAAIFHPITILFLDDNKNFLDALKLVISNQCVDKLEFVSDPKKALDILQNIKNNDFFYLQPRKKYETDSATKQVFDLDITKIYKTTFDTNRFQRMAILVVDYEMGALNGIDFCSYIKNDNVKRIMLTGEADEKIAVEAFNKGVINKFLLKQSEKIIESILSAINQIKAQYFSTLSRTIFESLNLNQETPLLSNTFQEVFNNILQNFNPTEYYLIDSSGSYLFIDASSKPLWLVIRSENDINEQLSLLEGLEAPEEIITPVLKREKFLFLLREEDYKKPIKDWHNFLLPANKVDDYYYCIIEGELADKIYLANNH